MSTLPAPIERLIAALKRLPGIGEKSATRHAFFLLGAPDSVAHELAESIDRLKHEIVLCELCFDLTDASPCAICRDEARDASVLCLVEEPADVMAIERSRSFQGRYHVLGGTLSPIDGVGPDELRIKELEARLGAGGITEVILATNPNVNGDATALYLSKIIKSYNVVISKLASGIPIGGHIEFIDHNTLSRALQSRLEF